MLRSVAAALLGGLLAGALDIAYAFVAFGFRGVTPERILQSIASGLEGPAAYEGGAASASLGAGLHFGIAVAMAAGFVVLGRLVPALLKRPILAGIAYGLVLFAIMYMVVVPLSAATVGMPRGWTLAGALFAHTVLVGLPIALIAARLLGPGARARAASA
jgi:hypothetical protein